MNLRLSAVLALVLAMLPGLAATTHASPASKLWSSQEPARDPGAAKRKAEYRRQMALGDRHAIEAAEVAEQRLSSQPRQPRALRTLVKRAVAAYERAAELAPDAAEPHYRAAEVIYQHMLDGPANTPVVRDRDSAEQALAHWRAFEDRAQLDPRATLVLFRRAILYTKMADDANWTLAIADYETLLARTDLNAIDPGDAATWLANLAETYMMIGRVGDAIDTYKRALDFSNQPLYGYGLAVAYDRDGQGQLAREIMFSYAQGDRLRSLSNEGIFFVPEGERHYYLALGHEAMGDIDSARRHYQRFIDSGAHPRFQPRARQHLSQLDKQARSPARRAPRIPEGLGL
jgi:tetratricopeptide (TPR) repeat protein